MAPRYIDEDHRRRLAAWHGVPLSWRAEVLQILKKYPLCDIYDLVPFMSEYDFNVILFLCFLCIYPEHQNKCFGPCFV